MTSYRNSTIHTDGKFPNDDSSTGFLALLITTDDFSGDYTYISNSTDDLNLIEMCEPSNKQEVTNVAIQVALFFIIFFLGVTGNGLVIATFGQYRRLRLRCMTDVFLFHLALSDLLLLLTLPLRTGEALAGGWFFGEGLCKLNHGVHAINTYSGLLLLACISADRYLVVVRARAAQKLRPAMLCYGGLCAIAVAIASVLLSLPELIFSSVKQEAGNVAQRCGMNIWMEADSGWVKKLANVAKIVGFCVPCVAMLVFYGAIGHVLLQGKAKCWRRQRTLRLMLALVLLFLLFQLPYTLVLSFRVFIAMSTCDEWGRAHLSEDVTRSLAYVRCCLNPVLYAFVAVRFRNDVLRLLQDRGCMCAYLSHLLPHPEPGGMTTPPPTTLTAVSSVHGPPKSPPVTASPLMPQDNSKESGLPNLLFCPQSIQRHCARELRTAMILPTPASKF
ncbi:C-C chemokine receptor type 7-like [Electrophorus electricus]|uniref:C-C chemokine receptor type 7-like n=1 Tax=Electrophorus electricus TaxID=8005 RepID=UPI0015CFFB4F|nr:C-C chemokine receptor type 7-like [Electrophorus electricus]